jgi:hypothetical protein
LVTYVSEAEFTGGAQEKGQRRCGAEKIGRKKSCAQSGGYGWQLLPTGIHPKAATANIH